VTPLPRKYHDKLITFPSESETKVNGKTITVPNLYPFASPHWVTVFSTHKPDLSKLDYSDMTNYFESGYEILTEIEKNGAHGVDGYWDIINWGNLAGASQVHPHAQRGGLLEKAITTLDSELEAYCSGAYKRMQSQDPFEEYMNIIRESDLVGWEDSYLFIHSPFAPKMSDQIDIILKPKIHSLSELNEKERYHIARCMLGVFHMQYHQRKVKHLNVIMHQQRFSSREKTYRIHWHIIPRDKSLWGGMEMNEKYVVDVYPETTAAEIRKHYKT
jgi:galactose-1-phosphate uridylyltransferase